MSLNLCTDELRKRIDALQNTINDCDKIYKDIISENKQDIDKISSIANKSASDNFDRIYSLFESLSLKEDINTIKQLCDQGLSEVRDKEGNTCMLNAIYKGNHSLVQTMIKCGCNRDAINNYGENALLLASMWCQSDTVRYLISIGFDKNWINQKSGMNALLYASVNDSFDIVKYLVSIGCDPKYKDKDGRNAIYCAAQDGNINIIKYLVSVGCDPNSLDNNGSNAIHALTFYDCPGRNKLINFLDNLFKLDITDSFYEKKENENEEWKRRIIDTARYLVSIGCDAKLCNYDGFNAILLASLHGNLELIKYLVSNGCDAKTSNKDGINAIHFASISSNIELIKYLVSIGCDVNYLDNNGMNAIHYAVICGKLWGMEKINSIVGDILDEKHMKLISKKCNEDQLNTIKYLISIGCNVNLIDNSGNNAFLYEIVEHFVAIGCKYDHNAVFHAISNGNFEVLEYLVSIGCDINYKLESSLSLLHVAAMYNNVDIIQFLLEQGLDINACFNGLFTPLEFAVAFHSVEAVEFLIKRGAKLNTVLNLQDAAQLGVENYPRYNEIYDILKRVGVCSD